MFVKVYLFGGIIFFYLNKFIFVLVNDVWVKFFFGGVLYDMGIILFFGIWVLVFIVYRVLIGKYIGCIYCLVF